MRGNVLDTHKIPRLVPLAVRIGLMSSCNHMASKFTSTRYRFKVQFLPNREQCVSIMKINHLMLFKNATDVLCKSRMTQKTFCRQNTQRLYISVRKRMVGFQIVYISYFLTCTIMCQSEAQLSKFHVHPSTCLHVHTFRYPAHINAIVEFLTHPAAFQV
jgi:hypothetical protein